MIPQNQLTKTDCLRACLASILELPIESVPDFTAMRVDPDSDYPIWYLELQHWLSRRGLVFVEIAMGDRPWNPLPYPLEMILVGNLLVDNGKLNGKRQRHLVRHMVVGHVNGSQFYKDHDPLPGEREFHDGVQAIVLLVPASLSETRSTKELPEKNRIIGG